MRKVLKGLLVFALLLAFGTVAMAAPKIGVVTGTVSQGEEEYRAGEETVEKYGKDRVIHVTYPDKFMDEQETTISQVMAVASDPEVKAIVICQAVPGTAAAIDKVKEVRDDILFVIGNPHEEPYMIAGKGDVLFEIDQPNRGAAIAEKSKEMGAKTLVHYSFPRHMSYPLLAERRARMEEACKKLGLEFVFVNAPDPTGEGGVPAAQQFILEDVPRQVEKYGPETAFFSTNCSMQEPLIKAVVKTKAIYPEQCCPSPFHALPNALGLEVESKGDVPYILKAIDEKVRELGVGGRISTWTAPIHMSFIRGGAEYAMDFANGKFEDKQDIARVKLMLEKAAGAVRIRPYDEEKAPNLLMVVGESIIFGK
ncbi:MAG: DUF3798 domain-containing protein [Fretibacterium sp.]|nr:DUF3798 domain-containing protein [Fretibacterium sp.]